MPYFDHSDNDVKEMLKYLGKNKVEELFFSIPQELVIKTPPVITGPLSEQELLSSIEDTLEDATTYKEIFRGAGAYRHFIPAAVDEISSRQEYYTAYTPYQPEVSQGSLQTMFEYQTMMSELTGLPVANASMYDGASATAEAALMAWHFNRRNKVIISGGVHPEYLTVLNTYLKNTGIKIEMLPLKEGTVDLQKLSAIDMSDVSSVIIQNPNFLGFLEKMKDIKKQSGNAVLIYVTNETHSLVVLRTPAEAGASICCGDAQSFGQPLAFGGPYLGFITCSEEFLHLLPGRIIGATYDHHGKRAFVMALAAREQHIRRERATSNICSNHAMSAVRAAVYLSLLGTDGLKSAALLSVKRAHELKEALSTLKNVEFIEKDKPFFNEFSAKLKINDRVFSESLQKHSILGPLELSRFNSSFKNYYLFTATEMNGRAGTELLVEAVKEASL